MKQQVGKINRNFSEQHTWGMSTDSKQVPVVAVIATSPQAALTERAGSMLEEMSKRLPVVLFFTWENGGLTLILGQVHWIRGLD